MNPGSFKQTTEPSPIIDSRGDQIIIGRVFSILFRFNWTIMKKYI